MNKLDFIGIGAQKSATTWLFECLNEHPLVRSAIKDNYKEINFFNHNYEKGYGWYHAQFRFGKWKNGEYSVLYFYDKNVPERIYKYNSSVKLLLALRNPIERAYSHHLHEIKRNQVPKHLINFSDAAKQNPSYIEMGRYATHLECFLEYFDISQIHIILFDDILTSPVKVIRDLFRFLEIYENFTPSSLEKKIYASHTYRSHALYDFINDASNFVQKNLGDLVFKALKATRLPALIRSYNEVEFDQQKTPGLSPKEYSLLSNMFTNEIDRLSLLISRDLSHWKRMP